MKKITFSVLLALVLLASLAVTANAQANRTYFTAVEYDCFTGMGTEPRMEGNVMHMRDVWHVNVDVSDTPEFNGLNTTFADGEFNMKTGGAVIRGTLSFQPYGIAGTWECISRACRTGKPEHAAQRGDEKTLWLGLYLKCSA